METKAEQTGSMPEADFALELGVPRESLAALRKDILVKDEDWLREKSGAVTLTAAGQEALKKRLGLPVAREKENGQDGAAGAEFEPVCLVVSSVPRLNRRILVAKINGGPEEVRVRVRDNGNFMAGMEIRARRDTAYQDVYTLEGRCPRYRGRW